MPFYNPDKLAIKYYVPPQKKWCEIGVSVYRVGVAMYHSSLVVDDVEWHFWEGYGVDPIPRYFDALQNAYVSINHVPFVTYVPIDLVKIPPINVARICEQLGASLFSEFTYDILTCNCNHFTNAVLTKLGLESKMPKWINRLAFTAEAFCEQFPFLRQWIDVLLNRSSITDSINPSSNEKIDWKKYEEMIRYAMEEQFSASEEDITSYNEPSTKKHGETPSMTQLDSNIYRNV
ncbi:deubiquitinase DESI2-like isoform X2 [Hylaeus volcanicus]|uniref:deubiquitinase DESI2-like isoform X2 n=1 Tax=Hylaeus volcanicus TaxID=313075 RepID=UPI0023B7AC54|nr:deubiquitinase DESI2-like isoform X2 [Hylaeus volcanicus]